MTDYKKGLWTAWAIICAMGIAVNITGSPLVLFFIVPLSIWLIGKNDPANKREKK